MQAEILPEHPLPILTRVTKALEARLKLTNKKTTFCDNHNSICLAKIGTWTLCNICLKVEELFRHNKIIMQTMNIRLSAHICHLKLN